MGYQSRKIKYKSQRERYEGSLKNIRLISIFLGIALIVWLIKDRYKILSWLETFFY